MVILFIAFSTFKQLKLIRRQAHLHPSSETNPVSKYMSFFVLTNNCRK